ncbi:hypothetical protein QQF64_020710 [Cirrhinus molitorella]|uniref:Uncharacterized protein n=1 Tax=Cirrhinus molitorella TaxID=172907 RepID=A0ABR3LBF1_9TELE
MNSRTRALTHCCSSRVGAGDKDVTVSCVDALLADMKEQTTEGKNDRGVCEWEGEHSWVAYASISTPLTLSGT